MHAEDSGGGYEGVNENWLNVTKQCAIETAMKLKQAERIVFEYERFRKAADKIEQAIRYLTGYLKDYSITVSRDYKPDRIVVTIEVRPYDELNTPETVKAKIYRELVKVFGEERRDEARRIADKIFDALYKA